MISQLVLACVEAKIVPEDEVCEEPPLLSSRQGRATAKRKKCRRS